jgi:type II secretion system protein H
VALGKQSMSAGVCSSPRRAGPGVRRGRGRDGDRAFSLIELMVVIIIVGIVAALAVPTMAAARVDRNAYDDAGQILQILREARTRAVARGAAILVAVSADGTTNRGRMAMYEAVSANQGGGLNRTPVSQCKAPTKWQPLDATNLGVLFVDGIDLNGSIEAEYDIETQITQYDGANVVPLTNAFICFTPLGRAFLSVDVIPTFDGALPSLSPLEFRVQRMQGGVPLGTTRSVLLPPNGVARLFSHV